MWQHIRMQKLYIEKTWCDELVEKISLNWLNEKTGHKETIAERVFPNPISEEEAEDLTLKNFVRFSKKNRSVGSAPSTVLKPPA